MEVPIIQVNVENEGGMKVKMTSRVTRHLEDIYNLLASGVNESVTLVKANEPGTTYVYTLGFEGDETPVAIGGKS